MKMKIISKRELEREYLNRIAPRGSTRTSQVKRELFKEVDDLVIGEGVFISKDEWPFKSEPYIGKDLGMKRFMVHKLIDKTGWLVRRVS